MEEIKSLSREECQKLLDSSLDNMKKHVVGLVKSKGVWKPLLDNNTIVNLGSALKVEYSSIQPKDEVRWFPDGKNLIDMLSDELNYISWINLNLK